MEAYARPVRFLVHAMLAVSAASMVATIGVVCLDVLLRMVGKFILAISADREKTEFLNFLLRVFHPIRGAYDIASIGGALAIACGLPYTTACKGHVAIEYFFLKLPPRGRIVVDALCRLAVMALLSLLAWRCILYGLSLRRAGQVTPTAQIPEFWIPYVIAASCAVVVLVKIYHLFQPGRTLIKP